MDTTLREKIARALVPFSYGAFERQLDENGERVTPAGQPNYHAHRAADAVIAILQAEQPAQAAIASSRSKLQPDPAHEIGREQEVRRLVMARLKSSIQSRLPQPILDGELQRHGLFLTPENLTCILAKMETEGLLSTSISVVELTTKGARS